MNTNNNTPWKKGLCNIAGTMIAIGFKLNTTQYYVQITCLYWEIENIKLQTKLNVLGRKVGHMIK